DKGSVRTAPGKKLQAAASAIEAPDAALPEITDGQPRGIGRECQTEYETPGIGQFRNLPSVRRDPIDLTGFPSRPYRSVGMDRHAFSMVQSSCKYGYILERYLHNRS